MNLLFKLMRNPLNNEDITSFADAFLKEFPVTFSQTISLLLYYKNCEDTEVSRDNFILLLPHLLSKSVPADNIFLFIVNFIYEESLENPNIFLRYHFKLLQILLVHNYPRNPDQTTKLACALAYQKLWQINKENTSPEMLNAFRIYSYHCIFGMLRTNLKKEYYPTEEFYLSNAFFYIIKNPIIFKRNESLANNILNLFIKATNFIQKLINNKPIFSLILLQIINTNINNLFILFFNTIMAISVKENIPQVITDFLIAIFRSNLHYQNKLTVINQLFSNFDRPFLVDDEYFVNQLKGHYDYILSENTIKVIKHYTGLISESDPHYNFYSLLQCAMTHLELQLTSDNEQLAEFISTHNYHKEQSSLSYPFLVQINLMKINRTQIERTTVKFTLSTENLVLDRKSASHDDRKSKAHLLKYNSFFTYTSSLNPLDFRQNTDDFFSIKFKHIYYDKIEEEQTKQSLKTPTKGNLSSRDITKTYLDEEKSRETYLAKQKLAIIGESFVYNKLIGNYLRNGFDLTEETNIEARLKKHDENGNIVVLINWVNKSDYENWMQTPNTHFTDKKRQNYDILITTIVNEEETHRYIEVKSTAKSRHQNINMHLSAGEYSMILNNPDDYDVICVFNLRDNSKPQFAMISELSTHLINTDIRELTMEIGKYTM